MPVVKSGIILLIIVFISACAEKQPDNSNNNTLLPNQSDTTNSRDINFVSPTVALTPNHVRGGRLYDNWPVETGMTGTITAVNALWDLADPALTGGPAPVEDEAWRCVNCHGFDYEGSIAFYYNSLLYLGSERNWTPEYVLAQIRDGYPVMLPDGTVQVVHNFGQFLADPELQELTAFIMEDVHSTTSYLNPDLGTAVGDGGVLADPVNGLAIYDGTGGTTFNGAAFDCITCHDPAAGTVPLIDIAALSFDTPWQFLHRVRFGVPRDPNAPPEVLTMPGLLEVVGADGATLLTTKDVVDVQRHLQESLVAP